MLLGYGDDRRTTAQVNLQTELVIRDSTGPAPGRVIAAAPESVASYLKE
jgi:LacI family transcriptional regulator